MTSRWLIPILVATALCGGCAHSDAPPAPGSAPPPTARRYGDVMYMPTSPEVVHAMLEMANAGRRDVLYDLGSGDGRIVIAAVRDFRVKRATGIEINPELIAEATANAKAAKVSDRARFVRQDLFEADFRDATVVTLFLLRRLNLRLLPKLLTDLEPGTRIVSHSFDMGSWQPERTQRVDSSTIYLWRIPAKGTPEYAAAMAAASEQ